MSYCLAVQVPPSPDSPGGRLLYYSVVSEHSVTAAGSLRVYYDTKLQRMQSSEVPYWDVVIQAKTRELLDQAIQTGLETPSSDPVKRLVRELNDKLATKDKVLQKQRDFYQDRMAEMVEHRGDLGDLLRRERDAHQETKVILQESVDLLLGAADSLDDLEYALDNAEDELSEAEDDFESERAANTALQAVNTRLEEEVDGLEDKVEDLEGELRDAASGDDL